MIDTIREIGKSIKLGSRYLPIRNRAASLATLAPPKDYLRQAQNVFYGTLKKWRYVRDPLDRELVASSPKAVYDLVMGGNGIGVGMGRGAGDCDDATVAIGAQLRSIGFPVRIAVTAPPGYPAGPTGTHVFIQTNIPNLGWTTVDPVVYPAHGFGHTTPHSRIMYFDLDGNVIGKHGNVIGLGESEMNTPHINYWQDLGLGSTDTFASGREPLDWQKYMLADFGKYVPTLGYIESGNLRYPLAAEVDVYEDPEFGEIAISPMLELSPDNYRYVKKWGQPYHGMIGLSDDGEQYYYDGLGGFFKRLFKKARKKIKAVGQKLKGALKKVMTRLPGGKYLIKLGSKLVSVAKKIVKPLAKIVGKYAAKLAPIAALIPGYGPAIAAGLYTAGKIANLVNKYGVVLKKVGDTYRSVFPSAEKAEALKKELTAEAEALKKKNASTSLIQKSQQIALNAKMQKLQKNNQILRERLARLQTKRSVRPSPPGLYPFVKKKTILSANRRTLRGTDGTPAFYRVSQPSVTITQATPSFTR